MKSNKMKLISNYLFLLALIVLTIINVEVMFGSGTGMLNKKILGTYSDPDYVITIFTFFMLIVHLCLTAVIGRLLRTGQIHFFIGAVLIILGGIFLDGTPAAVYGYFYMFSVLITHWYYKKTDDEDMIQVVGDKSVSIQAKGDVDIKIK